MQPPRGRRPRKPTELTKVVLPIINKVIPCYYYVEMDPKTGEAISTGRLSITRAIISAPWDTQPNRFKEVNEAEYKNAKAFGIPESEFDDVAGLVPTKEKGA